MKRSNFFSRVVELWARLRNAGLSVLRRFLMLWVRTRVLPEDIASLGIDLDVPVFYMLEKRSRSNLLVVEQACIDAGLPRPLAGLEIDCHKTGRAVFPVIRMEGWPVRRPVARIPAQMEGLVDAVRTDPTLDIQLVPASVFWGRSPDREEEGWLRSWFSDTWAPTGPIRQIMTIVLHGRNTFVQFNKPIHLRQLVDEDIGRARTLRKLNRVVRVHFRRQRTAMLGPDLSHRRTVVDSLVRTTRVQRAIGNAARNRDISEEKATRIARGYATEIAADYSYPMIRFADRVLTQLWNRLYDGVQLNHDEVLQEVAPGNSVVYVPCHRSHIDYLLLSYVLYQKGFVPPHVAAGINLNLPVVGTLLRRVGAFYLRRKLQGNRLYTAVFSEYVRTLIEKGVAMEYFIEGGRSRTGRLLPPRPGMLAMTMRAWLEDTRRPLVFIPVYFGYEKLVEGQAYLSELSGAPKSKETFGGLLRSMRRLKSEFGRVHVNFGEPIFLDVFLDAEHPTWRESKYDPEERPGWLNSVAGTLGDRIMTRINEAASVNPINLLALTLLSTSRQAMGEQDLIRMLGTEKRMLQKIPYSEYITLPEMGPAEMIEYGERMEMVERRTHSLGDVIGIEEPKAPLMTYFRNNVLHLFAIPSLVAGCFINCRELARERVREIIELVYPFIQSELFLPWPRNEVGTVADQTVDAMLELALLKDCGDGKVARPATTVLESGQLALLAQIGLQTLERFFMTIAVLGRAGSGKLTQEALEEMCQLMAQRIAMLHEYNAPEFADRAVFRNFIRTLIREGMVTVNARDKIEYDQSTAIFNEYAHVVLSDQVRHAILQLAVADSEKTSDEQD